MPALPTWSETLLVKARELYESGKYSASQISGLIGNGKSRNSIISIAHRRGWINPNPKRGGNEMGNKRPRPSGIRRIVYRTEPVIDPLAPNNPVEIFTTQEFLGLTIEQLAKGQCKFPDGDGPYLFCGQPQKPGSSYCNFHHGICWQKPGQPSKKGFFAPKNSI